jgi:hypothetical protein
MLRIASFLLLALSFLPAPQVILAAPRSAKSASATAPARGDAQIQSVIQEKLAKSKIGKDGFRFRVNGGVVTWEGSTDVVQHKGAATRMAKTSGAIRVVNNIQVSSAAKAKAVGSLRKAAVQSN